jgi:hypothetical protein
VGRGEQAQMVSLEGVVLGQLAHEVLKLKGLLRE